MSATAPTRSRPAAPDPARVELACLMVARARLPTDVDQERAAAVLARALAAYPPGSPHGGLLGAALRPRSPAEKRRGPRPPAEVAVRRLVGRGQVPTPRAVAGEVERRHAKAVSRTVRRQQTRERLRPLVEGDAPAVVAALTADHQRRTGQPPPCSWLAPRLADRLGITVADSWALVHLLGQDPQPLDRPDPSTAHAEQPD